MATVLQTDTCAINIKEKTDFLTISFGGDPIWGSVLVQVLSGLLDTGEQLFEQKFIFRLALFTHHTEVGQSPPRAAGDKRAGGGLDGFMSEPI